jgi:hypothetical protein
MIEDLRASALSINDQLELKEIKFSYSDRLIASFNPFAPDSRNSGGPLRIHSLYIGKIHPIPYK